MALTERLAVIVDAKAGGAITEFKRAARAADGLGDSAKQTSGLFDRLGAKAGVSGAAIKSGLATVGVGAAVALGAAVSGAVREYVRLAGEVDDFQDVAGATAQESSRLVNVVKQLGIAPEDAARGFFLLGRNIGQGKDSLAELGIQVEKNADGTVNLTETLGSVRAAYQGTNDITRQNAIAAAAFGKAGAGLVDVLQLTDAQLNALASRGPVFSQSEIDNAKQLAINVKAMGSDIDKVQSKVGGFVASKLLDFAGGFGRIEEALGLIPPGAALAGLAERNLAAETELAAEAARAAAEKRRDEARQLKDLQGGLFSVIDAQRAAASASRAVGDSTQTVAVRQKALSDLLKSAVVDVKAVEAAERSLASAQRGHTSAIAAVAEAQERLNRALAPASVDDAKDADLTLAEAKLGVADAADRILDAQKEVDDAKAAGEADRLADAERGLTGATLSLERAKIAEARAAQAVIDLNPQSEAGARRVAEAQKALDLANLQVVESERQVATAAAELATAEAGDVDRTDKIAEARRGLRDAQQGLSDAQYNAFRTGINLRDVTAEQRDRFAEAGDQVERLNAGLLIMAGFGSLATLPGQAVVDTVRGLFGAKPLGGGVAGKRAAGGPVRAGGTYVVGERGPELLQMGSSRGFVIPNGGGGGGSVFNVNVTAGVGADGRSIAAVVVDALRAYDRQNGGVPIRATA